MSAAEDPPRGWWVYAGETAGGVPVWYAQGTADPGPLPVNGNGTDGERA